MLESRHLVGLFLGVVLLCCVFFTLGYVMGRTQYGAGFHAAASARDVRRGAVPTPVPGAATSGKAAAPASGEWSFGSARGADNLSAKPESQPLSGSTPKASGPSPASSKSTVSPSKDLARFRPPAFPHGALVLQLAALKGEGDALALADALQQKQYPAFVVMPGADNLYRVQVGPYADLQSANVAKRSLEREGFKPIIKR